MKCLFWEEVEKVYVGAVHRKIAFHSEHLRFSPPIHNMGQDHCRLSAMGFEPEYMYALKNPRDGDAHIAQTKSLK